MIKLGAKVVKMINSGRSIHEISESTGLPEEEIKEIIEEIEGNSFDKSNLIG